MKNTIKIISALFVFTTVGANAQIDLSTDNREEFEFGIKAGVNVSNVWDSKGEDFQADARIGLATGVYFAIPIGKYIGFQPEVLLSQKGLQGSGTLLGFPYSFSRTTTYLDVPLLLQIKPAPFMTIVAGPTFSYLFKQKDVYTFGSNSAEQEQEFENDEIRKNTLGSTVGLDFYIASVVLSARAGWDFQNNLGDGTSTAPRYKNRWLQFTVGFKI